MNPSTLLLDQLLRKFPKQYHDDLNNLFRMAYQDGYRDGQQDITDSIDDEDDDDLY